MQGDNTMNLDDAKKIRQACTIADITSNWTKMTDRHLPPNGEGTQFMTAVANDVIGLIAKATKTGGFGGGGALTACNAYSAADDASKVIIVATFPAQVGARNPGGAACFNIQVVLGKGADGKLIFYSAYPVVAPPPAAGLLGAL